MAAITGATSKNLVPQLGYKEIVIFTPSTADSADTIDVSSASATGGETLSVVKHVVACDATTGDSVTATWSTTTVTLDASGGTTNHEYVLRVLGY